MRSLRLAVNYFANDTVFVKSKAGGTYVDGKWQPAESKSTELKCSVQPYSGKDLKDMPEGIRGEAKYIVDFRQSVSIDDTITFSGKDYRVLHEWPSASGAYHRVAIGLLENDNG